jgi:hypothetical protein
MKLLSATVLVAALVAGAAAAQLAPGRASLHSRAQRHVVRAASPLDVQAVLAGGHEARSASRRLVSTVGNFSSIVSVLDFGAKGDNATDNTAAFQAALDSLGAGGGGIAFIPAGVYIFSGSLNVPRAVTLLGTYETVPSHEIDQGGDGPTDGSVLSPRGGRGNASAAPFITLNEDTTLRGVVIFYPDQVRTGNEAAHASDAMLRPPHARARRAHRAHALTLTVAHPIASSPPG